MVEVDGKTYYGTLKDIYQIDYYKIFKGILFRYDWIDINSSRDLKKDANGFTLENFTRLIHTGVLLKDDPFIFSSQAHQVFFVQDARDKDWATIIKTKPWDLYDLKKQLKDDEDDNTYTDSLPFNFAPVDDIHATLSLVRIEFEENANA